MKITHLLLLIFLAAISDPALARDSVPIVNYDKVPVARPDGKALTADQVKQAITAAATDLGWNIQPGENGALTATLNVQGKHTAAVDITYTATRFSVRYGGSYNLSYKKAEYQKPGSDTGYSGSGRRRRKAEPQELIHPNYNRWVAGLVKAINAGLQKN